MTTPPHVPFVSTSAMALHWPVAGRWLPASVARLYDTGKLSPWLGDMGSLTARLIDHSEGRFQVRVLAQGWGRARPDEALALGIDPRSQVLLREVVLMGNGEPWVWARSVLPWRFLQGARRSLARLNDQPLGAWLFRQPSLRRGPMEMACFDGCDQHIPSNLHSGTRLWGRRSLFFVEQQPVLVAETFLPALIDTLI